MGKLGRFACIFVPMGLTLVSLICLILVFSGQTNRSMDLQKDLYFFKADTSSFTANPESVLSKVPDIPSTDLDELLKDLTSSAEAKKLKDFYKIGLWNYCEGDKDADGKETVTSCSPRQSKFWFNPIEVWGLNGTNIQESFPKELEDGLRKYKKVAGWMFTAYVVAISLTVAEFFVGILAIFSRWGSLVTTIVSGVQTVFIVAAAATSTALYASLVGVFESVLKPYKIKASIGDKMLTVLWIGVAFSIASGFFWSISVCCCSGKSGHKKVVVEKAPYTYERVASPYLGGRDGPDTHQMHPMPSPAHKGTGGGFEPYRQDNRV